MLYVIAAFIPLWIIIAFRDSSVGTDTGITYYRVFQHALNGSFQVYADNVEVGYLTLVNILAKISSDYFIVIFVTGTLVWGIFYYYIVHNSENIAWSILLFFLSFNYFHLFNGIRQYLAIGISLLGFRFLYDRKLIKYLIVILLASTFHILALVYIPVYFLYDIKCDIKKSIVVLTAVTVMFSGVWALITRFVFSPKLLYYLKTTKYYHSFTISYITIAAVIVLLGLTVQLIYKVEDKKYNINLWMQLASLVIAVNASYIPEHHRVFWLFSVNSMIFVPMIAETAKKYKIFIYIAVAILFLADFTRSYLTGMDQVQEYLFWMNSL